MAQSKQQAADLVVSASTEADRIRAESDERVTRSKAEAEKILADAEEEVARRRQDAEAELAQRFPRLDYPVWMAVLTVTAFFLTTSLKLARRFAEKEAAMSENNARM